MGNTAVEQTENMPRACGRGMAAECPEQQEALVAGMENNKDKNTVVRSS